MYYYATFFQGFLIAVTAQFIPLLVYQYRDPAPEIRMDSPAYRENNLQESLGGYVKYSLSQFPISVLLNDSANPFPLASAIALKFYENDIETDFFYQPYHRGVDCFNDSSKFSLYTIDVTTDFINSTTAFFSEEGWDRFTNTYQIDPGQRDHDNYISCINLDFPCK